MAVYVLLEFDDNAQAKRFVEKVNGRWGTVAKDYLTRRVIGVWYKPTKFCTCATDGTKQARGSNPFFRAQKTGWWVHYPCGRPTRAWGQSHNHWASALGTNVLPDNDHYKPSGWGTAPTERDNQEGRIVPLGDGQVPAAVTGERLKQRKRRERDRPRRV